MPRPRDLTPKERRVEGEVLRARHEAARRLAAPLLAREMALLEAEEERVIARERYLVSLPWWKRWYGRLCN